MNKLKYFIKKISTFVLIFILCIALVSCKKHKTHIDKNNDGICDKCEEVIKPSEPNKPEEIKASLGDENIFIGATTSLDVEILPNTFEQEYKVEIIDSSIVSFENGTFTAKNPGTTKITITSKKYQELSTEVELTVMPDLENESFDVQNIVTVHGENASTSAMVKYQTHNKNTSVEYTVASDTEFKNATKVVGSCYYFCELDPILTGPFSERYIYRTNLNNLTPDTDYIYRINKGDDTYSEVYTFKTAKGTGPTTFIYLTDTHYWVKADGTSHGSELSEEIISAIKKEHPEATMVIDSGDTIDTGGNDKIWDIMYQHRESLKTLTYASVPGNHEYYIRETGQWDNRFFKAMSTGLLNGPKGKKLGSSYYFVYNDVLFLMIDNASKSDYEIQYEWIENLLRNTTAKYSVVNFHIPSHESESTSNRGDYDENFTELFQKYGVDLVLSGHWHGEDYDFVYNEKDINSGEAGVHYFRGTSSGAKTGDSVSPAGYAITIDENGHITIQRYNRAGENTKTYSFDTIKYKEPIGGEVNLTCDIDEENMLATFTWGKEAYGIYKSITIKEVYRNLLNKEIFILSTGYQDIVVPLDREGYDSLFEVTILKTNGEKEVKYFEIKNTTASVTVTPSSTSAKLTFKKAEGVLFDILIDHYDIYVNGEKVGSTPYLQTAFTINNLKKNTKYKVECKAVDYDNTIAFVLTEEFTTTK